MASITFTRTGTGTTLPTDGMEATYLGQTFFSRFYPGDTRAIGVQIQKHREFLFGEVEKHARANGLELPDGAP